jgi:hypothetical protein
MQRTTIFSIPDVGNIPATPAEKMWRSVPSAEKSHSLSQSTSSHADLSQRLQRGWRIENNPDRVANADTFAGTAMGGANVVDFCKQLANTISVHRATTIVLLLAFMATGSGLMGELHRREHAADQSVLRSAKAAWQAPGEPGHDERNCAVCLTLHMPFMASGYVPLLICLGLWVEFLTSLRPRLNPQRVHRSIDCRGPPSA